MPAFDLTTHLVRMSRDTTEAIDAFGKEIGPLAKWDSTSPACHASSA